MAALQVGDSALRDIYFRIANARASDDQAKAGKPANQAAQSTGASVDLGAIFADVFGDEDGRTAPPSGVLEDRAERFAREAAEYWLENMRRIGADDKALSHFGVDRQHLGWLIDELVVGAHRLKLIDQLSLDVRALENAANAKWEDIAERQVRTAASALNGYVSALGFDQLPLDQRPGLPPDAPTRRVFERPGADQRRADAQRGARLDLRRLLPRLDARLPAARDGQCRLRRRPRDHGRAERAVGRHPARRGGLRLSMPMRATVLPQPEPGHAILRVSDLDAPADGLALSLAAPAGPGLAISPTTAGAAPRPGWCRPMSSG